MLLQDIFLVVCSDDEDKDAFASRMNTEHKVHNTSSRSIG